MSPLFLGTTFVLLNALDAGLTLLCLAAGGVEGNPTLYAWGWPAFAAIKVAVSVGVGALAYVPHRAIRIAVTFGLFLMAAICMWNSWMLARLTW